jgi:hypothetical protein
MKRGISLCALAACVALPGTASASSGSITNVYPVGDGRVSATYTTTYDQCGQYSCAWYPHAWQIPASSSCYVDKTYLTYVGGPGDDIYYGPATETATDTFYPKYNPARICLYANGPSGEIFMADYVYPPPVAAPAPAAPAPAAPTPAPTVTPVSNDESSIAPMSIREAKYYLPRVLKKKFKSKFSPSTLTRSCYRLSSETVKCRVAWRRSGSKYAGSVTMRNDPDDPDGTFLYRISVRRIGSARAARVSLVGAEAVKAEAAIVNRASHRHGCHRWHSCPSDHATYRWRGMLCVKPSSPKNDGSFKRKVRYGGLTYHCKR